MELGKNEAEACGSGGRAEEARGGGWCWAKLSRAGACARWSGGALTSGWRWRACWEGWQRESSERGGQPWSGPMQELVEWADGLMLRGSSGVACDAGGSSWAVASRCG
jgi:hypothetical protein